ncbi:MAG: SWIM zinc finger family protein [Anaerolineae bacterium]|nr:SWIM zinc finger family protein [Anaerolineae bacterium]
MIHGAIRAIKPANIKKLQTRSRALTVRQVTRDTYAVASKSQPNLLHIVTISMGADGAIHGRCTCPWSHHGGFGCVHVMAVLHKIAERKKRHISFWPTREEAQRQHKRVLRLAGNKNDAIYITSRRAHRDPIGKAS